MVRCVLLVCVHQTFYRGTFFFVIVVVRRRGSKTRDEQGEKGEARQKRAGSRTDQT